MQGGATGDSERKDLVSLGTISYEPLWFFYRGRYPGRKLVPLAYTNLLYNLRRDIQLVRERLRRGG